jgi:hypothetical protein
MGVLVKTSTGGKRGSPACVGVADGVLDGGAVAKVGAAVGSPDGT